MRNHQPKYKPRSRRDRLQEVMEFCVTPKSVEELVHYQSISRGAITLLTRELCKLGFMRKTAHGIKGRTGWAAIFTTIKLGVIPADEVKLGEKEYKPFVVSDPVVARMFGFTDFVPPKGRVVEERMPSWTNRIEHRGIGSTFGRFDTV